MRNLVDGEIGSQDMFTGYSQSLTDASFPGTLVQSVSVPMSFQSHVAPGIPKLPPIQPDPPQDYGVYSAFAKHMAAAALNFYNTKDHCFIPRTSEAMSNSGTGSASVETDVPAVNVTEKRVIDKQYKRKRGLEAIVSASVQADVPDSPRKYNQCYMEVACAGVIPPKKVSRV